MTHALLSGSPAIDAGDPGFIAPPDFDQRGAPYDRVVVGRIDMGAYEVQIAVPDSADFDGDGFVTGFDFLSWQRGFGTPAPDAVKTDGDADNDQDVDGDDLAVWESQYGTTPAPIVAAEASSSEQGTASYQESQTAALTTEPLSADLVDAVIAMDHALRQQSESRLASPSPFRDEHFDWMSSSTMLSQELTWQGTSEIANHSLRGQNNKVNDDRPYRDAENDTLNEELLDELFADGELNSLL